MDFEFYKFIPRGINENLRWRLNAIEKAFTDHRFANAMYGACAADPVFWLNGFCWTYDPRVQPFLKVPFILFDYQVEALSDILDAIGNKDLLLEKSRDMGASWLCMSALAWNWLFKPLRSFLAASRNESYVDHSGDPKSLFWKFDFLIDNLPPWLQPIGYDRTKHRRHMHAENPENGSVLDGESTTGNLARGDRRTCILLDEFAAVTDGRSVLKSTRDATSSRLFNSTPAGVADAFYELKQTNIDKLRLHWSKHPFKAVGLYTTGPAGDLSIIDKDGYPDDYQPILDGKLRSSWYDAECERCTSPQEIAQELDIDYRGAGYQFFDPAAIQQVILEHAREPLYVLDFEHNPTTQEVVRFREVDGDMRVWMLLSTEEFRPPPEEKFVFGIDISAGTGASNSCISAWNVKTHQKVFEYVNPYIRPEPFAARVVALAKWFNEAYLIWEARGPGSQFGARVKECGYTNVYYKRRGEDAHNDILPDMIAGWHPDPEAKLLLLGDYRMALYGGEALNFSKIALEETLEYVYMPNGRIGHSRASGKIDPSGAGHSHADRVVADALGWKACHEKPLIRKIERPKAPIGSLAWRQKQREKSKLPQYQELGKGW